MRKVLGGILLGIGLIMALLSGLCSALLFLDPNLNWEDVQIILVVGGIPFAIGAALAVGGWFLFRSEEPGGPVP